MIRRRNSLNKKILYIKPYTNMINKLIFNSIEINHKLTIYSYNFKLGLKNKKFNHFLIKYFKIINKWGLSFFQQKKCCFKLFLNNFFFTKLFFWSFSLYKIFRVPVIFNLSNLIGKNMLIIDNSVIRPHMFLIKIKKRTKLLISKSIILYQIYLLSYLNYLVSLYKLNIILFIKLVS